MLYTALETVILGDNFYLAGQTLPKGLSPEQIQDMLDRGLICKEGDEPKGKLDEEALLAETMQLKTRIDALTTDLKTANDTIETLKRDAAYAAANKKSKKEA
jgi:hypothetical protein